MKLSLLCRLASLGRDARAGVTTLVALALPIVLGATGLAFDVSRGLQQRVINQRAADMGALAAALAYKHAGKLAVLTPTAQDIVRANGLSSATVSALLIEDFPNVGEQSVRVEVEESLPVTIGKVLGISGSFPVSAQALASLSGGESPFAAPCYLALSSGANAFSVTGGAKVEAASCAVAAVGQVAMNGELISASDIISGSGDILLGYGTLAANSLRFAGKLDKQAWNTKVPPEDKWFKQETALTDPWAADSERVAANGLLGTYTAIPGLTNPTTPGGSNWHFDWTPSASVQGYKNGANNKYLVPAGTYDIGKLSTGGDIHVVFAPGSVIRVANGVAIGGGSSVDFGNSDVYVNGGFDSGSNGVTFGAGVLWIGSGTVKFAGTNFKGDGDVMVNATLQLGGGQKFTMGKGSHAFGRIQLGGGGWALLDDGDLTVPGGINIAGGSELGVGRGGITIGPHSDGRAIFLDGSAGMFMGDGTFSAKGNIETSGNTRLIFGKTANHLVKGNVTMGGSVLFGKGRYTIDGDFAAGKGGQTWPYYSNFFARTYGSSLEGVNVTGFNQAGIDVTFILSGKLDLSGSTSTRLDAPATSQSGGAIAQLLLSSMTTKASTWGGGTSNRFGGVIHMPNAAISMTGGNSTSASKCMSLVAKTISVSGGAATGTACEKMQGVAGGSSGSAIRLVG